MEGMPTGEARQSHEDSSCCAAVSCRGGTPRQRRPSTPPRGHLKPAWLGLPVSSTCTGQGQPRAQPSLLTLLD